MYKLIRENVVKLTSDPDKRDRLIADGFTLVPEAPAAPEVPAAPVVPEAPEEPEAPAENTADEKPAKGKAAADGKRTDKA